MKLKKQKKMLTLNRETISHLNPIHMENVNGGQAQYIGDGLTESCNLPSETCGTLDTRCLYLTECAALCFKP